MKNEDWSAGTPACMSAKHEKGPTLSNHHRPTPLNRAALEAGMPALQSLCSALVEAGDA